MSNLPPIDDEMPAEIDFSKAVRGLHHIPAGSKVFMPAEVLRRDIEISEALKWGSNIPREREGSWSAGIPLTHLFPVTGTTPANVVS
jgi:hypothetical protein